MKDLKITHRNKNEINDDLILEFELKYNIKFPEYLIEFLKKYSGCTTVEDTYINPNFNIFYTVSYFCELYSDYNPSIQKLTEGNKFYHYENWIPFATDPGGWVFNISISQNNMGEIWINKFDSSEENPFEFVAPSFENFIDGLKTEEESNF